jgi:hypothetical protein
LEAGNGLKTARQRAVPAFLNIKVLALKDHLPMSHPGGHYFPGKPHKTEINLFSYDTYILLWYDFLNLQGT